MKNIITIMGKTPQIEEEVYIDPSSRIIGDVLLKKGCSIWPMCVLRADSSHIVIEDEAAVLDKVMIEAPAKNPVVVGKRALISHGAVLHGCTVQEGSLIVNAGHDIVKPEKEDHTVRQSQELGRIWV